MISKKEVIRIAVLICCILFSMFIMTSCSELLHKECRVNDDYKVYDCGNGLTAIDDLRVLKMNYFIKDSCAEKFDYDGKGVIINDSVSYFNCVDTINSFNNPDSLFWDFNSRTLVYFEKETDQGSRVYSSVFGCINSSNKEVVIRCQYELSDQCAGSGIHYLSVYYWISLPKVPEDYTFTFSVENINPF